MANDGNNIHLLPGADDRGSQLQTAPLTMVDLFKEAGKLMAFRGPLDHEIAARARDLSDAYAGKYESRFTNVSLPAAGRVTNEELSFKVHHTFWPAITPKDKPSKDYVVILAPVFPSGRSNDHTAEHLSAQGFNVLCVDYPGKGRSDSLPHKEDYSPLNYALALERVLAKATPPDAKVHLIGNSHGGRVIFDLYQNDLASAKITSVTIGDMGPERPAEAAMRRALRNQHNPLYANLTEATVKLRKMFSPNSKTQPEDYALNILNHDFELMSGRGQQGLRFSYDPRAMFAYCDELMVNPTMNAWGGFAKIDKPILMLHGLQSNTVSSDLLKKMASVKEGRQPIIASGETVVASRAPFNVLHHSGFGHYPEPHRVSQMDALVSFLRAPDSFNFLSPDLNVMRAVGLLHTPSVGKPNIAVLNEAERPDLIPRFSSKPITGDLKL